MSVRMVMFSTLLAALFAFTSYSAKIVAILQTPSDAIQTIDDLTRSPMTLGVQETTYKRVYFAVSPSHFFWVHYKSRFKSFMSQSICFFSGI